MKEYDWRQGIRIFVSVDCGVILEKKSCSNCYWIIGPLFQNCTWKCCFLMGAGPHKMLTVTLKWGPNIF